ncbi:MAG TPA: protoglobin domain-containing protein, partial [Polyangiaceae bacterium]
KRYVRFDDRDAQLLLAFREHAEPEFPRIAQEFYDRIREHADAHEVFTGEEQIVRLQQSLVLWMSRVCGGIYDQAYHEQTARIGRVHVKIGLPQRYMLTAMALIRVALLRIADRVLGEHSAPTREALIRILDLELAVMLETYKDSYVERIRSVEQQERIDLGQALARAEQRYVNAVELARVMIIGLQRDGKILLFNREAERLSGFARDEVLGRPFVDLLGVEDSDRELAACLTEALAGRDPAKVREGTLKTRAGKYRDVVWNFGYAGPHQGDDVVLFAIGQDLTASRAMEERTRQAEKLAAIGTLAAGLAHEIRNPLNGAQLHLSFLERAIKKQASQQDMLEATRVVGDEITRLANLVAEFLDFARPKPLQRKAVSLQRLCEHARSLVQPQAESVGVLLSCDLPSVELELEADQAKFTQVLLNLLQNAVESTGSSGGGSVILRVRRAPRTVTIEVEDDGPGLQTPDAPIFDAFFSTKEGGTGLGLAITHRIVTDHGGSIDVSSKSGKTTFRVSLPLTDATEGTP